jgi:hypothetical protein
VLVDVDVQCHFSALIEILVLYIYSTPVGVTWPAQAKPPKIRMRSPHSIASSRKWLKSCRPSADKPREWVWAKEKPVKRIAIAALVLGLTSITTAPGTGTKSCKHEICSGSVIVITPASGSTVSGTITVAGKANDSYGIVIVEVKVDTSAYQVASGTSPWTFSLDTMQYANGSHTITAQAIDKAGNLRTASVAVSFSNSTSGSSNPGSTTSSGTTWYVSRNGNNADGLSWATAWNELANINWSVIRPGDTVLIDGGSTPCAPAYEFTTPRPGVSCGMEYDTTMTVGASGTPSAPINIQLSTASGHNGTAVFFGGRATPLPYCDQANYTAKQVRTYGINVGSNHGLVFDGSHISGIMIYGAMIGIEAPGTSAGDLTFEHMEIFDNGSINTMSSEGLSGTGVVADNQGVSLGGGPYDSFIGDLIHDNGVDQISDNNETNRPNGSLNGLVLNTDWIYDYRDNPAYPGNGMAGPEASCLHSDGLQLGSGGADEGPMTVENTIFGPLLNQGLYPDDSDYNSAFNDVSVTNSLFLVISHNIINDDPVYGWYLDRDTLFAPQGGFEIPCTPTSCDDTMTNVIKYGGYVYTPNWAGTASGNVSYLNDQLPGTSTSVDPGFTTLPSGTAPYTYAEYAAANFTPTCSICSNAGSSLHTLNDILTRIEALSP